MSTVAFADFNEWAKLDKLPAHFGTFTLFTPLSSLLTNIKNGRSSLSFFS